MSHEAHGPSPSAPEESLKDAAHDTAGAVVHRSLGLGPWALLYAITGGLIRLEELEPKMRSKGSAH